MILRPFACHRMDGSAHFVILWHENAGFCEKIGHRMTNTASIFILWQENESGGAGEDLENIFGWGCLGELFFGRGGAAELAERSKRNQRRYLPSNSWSSFGGSSCCPRISSWTEAHPAAVERSLSPARIASSAERLAISGQYKLSAGIRPRKPALFGPGGEKKPICPQNTAFLWMEG